MSFKLEELGGHAFYQGLPGPQDQLNFGWKPGWYFISERGLSKGKTFGPWPTPDSALECGPVQATCFGVEMATRLRDENHQDELRWEEAQQEPDREPFFPNEER